MEAKQTSIIETPVHTHTLDPYAIPRTPAFVLEERRLQENLQLIESVQKASGCSIILALKGFSMHAVFPEIAAVASGATASSLNEFLLASEFFPDRVHTYSPVYRDDEFDLLAAGSTHISFNSIQQYQKYKSRLQKASPGLRVNPEYSIVETSLYDPCAPGSRLGVKASALNGKLPEGIEGLHVHNLCESDSYALEETLKQIEKLYGELLPSISWLNLGGGHLMTRKGYDTRHLIQILTAFKQAHPNISIILEPGAAFAWETGVLVSTVLDIIEQDGYAIAMLDTSFTTHMPDCLEMPYIPRISGARISEPEALHKANPASNQEYSYKMGGCSCLAGDQMGDYIFTHPLKPGDRLVFEDMMHYTMVKTHMFNGIGLPDIGIWQNSGNYLLIRSFGFQDYRSRLS